AAAELARLDPHVLERPAVTARLERVETDPVSLAPADEHDLAPPVVPGDRQHLVRGGDLVVRLPPVSLGGAGDGRQARGVVGCRAPDVEPRRAGHHARSTSTKTQPVSAWNSSSIVPAPATLA